MPTQEYPPEIKKWWESVGKPKLVVAPMVDASELSWRNLSRRYGAELCYTPMLHSRIFVEDAKYRMDNFFNATDAADRPLIVQFCGNDPKILAKAAALVKDHCDAVDINLGCPQVIAKRGHYGAFLQNEWELVSNIVKEIRNTVQMPVTCKIRIFPDVEKTVAYAKTIVDSGCFMLTVHGRTIDQKGPLTGLADWKYIKAVRDAVNIPVLANGNIQYLEDVWNCIKTTGVDGVMSAEGNLHNPAIFKGISPPTWQMAAEYIELARIYPCPISYSRGHIFKIFHHLLMMEENFDAQQLVAKATTLDDFEEATRMLKERYEPYVNGTNDKDKEIKYDLPLAPWFCQPYERPTPKNLPPGEAVRRDPTMSNNKWKRLNKNPRYKGTNERVPLKLCASCVNPAGVKCDHQRCKICCRSHCFTNSLDCAGHKTTKGSFSLVKRLKPNEDRTEASENTNILVQNENSNSNQKDASTIENEKNTSNNANVSVDPNS